MKKVFVAGLQGEAGGDVRFNSEGDAVSNDHDIYHALRYKTRQDKIYFG